MTINVTFWGVRGSLPCCSEEHIEFGGNTSCVQIDLDGRIVVIDAGSGIRMLGNKLFEQNRNDLVLLISHTHWDHILGFPFFSPIYEKTADIDIYAPMQPDGKKTEEIFATLMSTPLFPLPLHAVPSALHFHDFTPSEVFDLFDGKVKMKTTSLTHPNGAAGYRLEYDGKAICYISDYEHGKKEDFERLAAFVQNSDMMIYDAMYTPEEYPQFVGWGHSTWEEAAFLTKAANVKKTALFHHAPLHTDSLMREIEQKAQKADPRLFAAKEYVTLSL